MKNGEPKKCIVNNEQYIITLDLKAFVKKLKIWRIIQGKNKEKFFSELNLSKDIDAQWKMGKVPSADIILLIKFATNNEVDFCNFVKFERISTIT